MSPTPGDPPPVRLRDGAVAIGGRPVLRGIDLTVADGEFLAVMGPNGSGKSTLVRALTGLRPLTAGALELFGTPLADFDQWRRVGFVPQRSSAVSGIPASVWEVVASGRLTHRRLLRPLTRADRAAVDEAIEITGLGGMVRDGVSQLSGGQQQRVLIARALAGRPELFFLDEPTAGVDLAHQDALAGALGHLGSRGATIVLVAHELGPLAPLVQRAVVMRGGRVAYDGPPLADHAVPHAHLDGAPAHAHDPGRGHHHDHDHDHHAEHADRVPFVASPLPPTEARRP